MRKYKTLRRSKNFQLFYDDCETELLRLLYDYQMTFADLARATNIDPSVISNLAYGVSPPIYRNGAVKPYALAICEYFLVDMSDVFPRYFCDINSKHYKFENIPYTTNSEEISDEDFVYNRIHAREIIEIIKHYLTAREFDIFELSVSHEWTFTEIGAKYKIGGTRANQIYVRVLRKIKHHLSVAERFTLSAQQLKKKTRQKKHIETLEGKITKYLEERKTDFDKRLEKFDKRLDEIIIVEERLETQRAKKAIALGSALRIEEINKRMAEIEKRRAEMLDTAIAEAENRHEIANAELRHEIARIEKAEAEYTKKEKAEANKGFFKKIIAFFSKNKSL